MVSCNGWLQETIYMVSCNHQDDLDEIMTMCTDVRTMKPTLECVSPIPAGYYYLNKSGNHFYIIALATVSSM